MATVGAVGTGYFGSASHGSRLPLKQTFLGTYRLGHQERAGATRSGPGPPGAGRGHRGAGRGHQERAGATGERAGATGERAGATGERAGATGERREAPPVSPGGASAV